RDFHVTGVQTCALPIFHSRIINSKYSKFGTPILELLCNKNASVSTTRFSKLSSYQKTVCIAAVKSLVPGSYFFQYIKCYPMSMYQDYGDLFTGKDFVLNIISGCFKIRNITSCAMPYP